MRTLQKNNENLIINVSQVIIHDRKPRNGTYCKESIVKLLGENLQLADENVTLCLALGYQRVQRLPGMLLFYIFSNWWH